MSMELRQPMAGGICALEFKYNDTNSTHSTEKLEYIGKKTNENQNLITYLI